MDCPLAQAVEDRIVKTPLIIHQTDRRDAAGAAWQDLCASVNRGPQAQRLTATRFAEFGALIEYDNGKLREKLMPAYRKMLELFRDKLRLAEDETRKHYSALVGFVDVWERWLANHCQPR